MFGLDTYYKMQNEMLMCKVEGRFEGVQIFDQLVVAREGDYYNKWGPFVSKSSCLKRFTQTDMAVHFTLNLPLMLR